MSVKRETVRSKAVVLAPIQLYQRFVSPALPRRCKYYPTCSAYAVDAIRELGVLRGLIVAGWRLLRCNPFSHGGYDPVDRRRLFSDPAHAGHSHTRSNRTREHAKLIPAETARRRTRERASDIAGDSSRERAEAEYVAR